MQGCKQGHMKLRIWGCKDARIQVSTHEHKNMRCENISKCTGTWGYKDVNKSNISIMYFTSILHIYVFVHMIYISNDTTQSTVRFWWTIYQTLPNTKEHQSIIEIFQKMKKKFFKMLTRNKNMSEVDRERGKNERLLLN